jgi:pyruvate,water dikinase
MAVVVQRLVPAEVAGVMFTVNPQAKTKDERRKTKEEMLIEASWGLGEAVVGGRVQPDVFRVERETGAVIEAVIADKRVMIEAGARGEANREIGVPRGVPRAVAEAQRRSACLTERDVKRLWELGRHAAEHFGVPQDIEWAIHGGQLYLLQSRPITTHLEAQADEELLRETQGELRKALAAGRGPWALHNLAETLAHPTPLTWSVMQRFMSGAGGFGAMYRRVGFEPSPEVCRDGFLNRIAGRIYMDAARAPEMFFEHFPFAYDLEELKRSPDASQSPPTLPQGSWSARRQAGKRLAAVSAKLHQLAGDFDHQLREVHFPALAAYVEAARKTNLAALSAAELIALWQQHEKRVLDEFAPLSLLPSMICGMALGELRVFIEEHLWQEDAEALAQLLSAGGVANRTVMADAELYEVALSERTLEMWLGDHGHRAAGEFDLAAPRWRERPSELQEMARRMIDGGALTPMEHREGTPHRHAFEADIAGDAAFKVERASSGEPALTASKAWHPVGEAVVSSTTPDGRRGRRHHSERPLERHRRTMAEIDRRVAELRIRLNAAQVAEFDRRLELVRRYVPFREDGKDYLMLGYELLRRVALEAGQRLKLEDDVFYLNRGEIFEALCAGSAALPMIERRKLAYRAEARHALPHVIDAQAVENLGDVPQAPAAAGGHKAFAVSSGMARGRAVILHTPTDAAAGALEKGYILVCPSTDPSWTPLFVNAAGLVMECGGTLSHGAVVAREMGLPAVVVADATRLFEQGEEIIVDGTRGWVGRGTEQAVAVSQVADPNDTRVERMLVPPPPGPKDRAANKVRNVLAVVWIVFILAFFLLSPAWVYGPTLAFLDTLLWPLVRHCGKPATVAIVAGAIAAVTLLLQRFLTDNVRLREAKRRAALLSKEADTLPADCPRKKALLALAAPVQLRMLLAALVPVGILLGPMVMPFVWFRERVDPAAWNAPPGTTVQVVAYVDADATQPVRITPPAGFTLDELTPAVVMPQAIRPTLERLLALYRQAPAAQEAWELKAGPDMPREKAAADLADYLARGIPAQPIRWALIPPKDYVGRFPITVSVGGEPSVTAQVVLGDAFPPAPKMLAGTGNLKQVRIVQAGAKQAAVFWRPLAWLGGIEAVGKLAAWDAGWVWLYILAYLPVLFGMRAILRVA